MEEEICRKCIKQLNGIESDIKNFIHKFAS